MKAFVRYALLSLPFAVLLAVAVWRGADEYGRIAGNYRANLTRQYREVAENLLKVPAAVEYRGPKVKGWRSRSALALEDGTTRNWGYELRDGRTFVWVAASAGKKPASVLGVYADPPRTANPADTMAIWAALSLLVVAGLTAYGIYLTHRTNRDRRDFLAATVHDLKTPLVGARDAIGRDDEGARCQIRRMLRMVENLQAFQRGGGLRRPQLQPVALADAFDEAYESFDEDYAAEKSGPVRMEGDLELKVIADSLMLIQILWNLLGNELKYAAPYGPVTARFVRSGDRVMLTIADVGPGMTAAERRRAFDRYYRAKSGRTSGKGGFGLGLATARRYARALDGELKVAANSPRGCRFDLSLPAAE